MENEKKLDHGSRVMCIHCHVRCRVWCERRRTADSHRGGRTEETGEEGISLAMAPAPGNETEEDFVDVNFTEQTKFELRVVKNGGINPDEDVTVKEASFSDIKDDMSVTLEGAYDGDVFIAKKVILYEFV